MSYSFPSTAYGSVDFSLFMEPITISSWFRPYDNSQTSPFIWGTSAVNSSYGVPILGLQQFATDVEVLFSIDGPLSIPSELIYSGISTTAWNNIVVTINGTTFSAYVNNVSLGSYLTSYDYSSFDMSGFWFGTNSYNQSQIWYGELAEFAIWNTILSATSITRLQTKLRNNILQIQPSNLKCYFGMGDYSNNSVVSGWINKTKNITLTGQSITGTIASKADTFPIMNEVTKITK